MATILINFLAKIRFMDKRFQHFAFKFLNEKDVSLTKSMLQNIFQVGDKNVTFLY